jgi:hypothetical protein
LTSRTGARYWQCAAEIVQFHSGTRGDTHGSCILLRGEDESQRFALETPEEIADLIRENWEKRISGEAAMGAEYGTGDYKIGKDGWT